MSISVCPLATINAPIKRVWSFLSEPTNYAVWWDCETRSIAPEGSASPGQKICAQASAFGGLWTATVAVTVNNVDEAKHQIHMTTVLPLGITVHNHITCLPLDPAHCRISFG